MLLDAPAHTTHQVVNCFEYFDGHNWIAPSNQEQLNIKYWKNGNVTQAELQIHGAEHQP